MKNKKRQSLTNSVSAENAELERKAYAFGKYIHANQSLCGFKYMVYAIQLVTAVPEAEFTGENGVYERIAEKFHAKNASSVERGIRHLCENLVRDTELSRYEAIFGTTQKLTNRRLIFSACNFIKYEGEKLNG